MGQYFLVILGILVPFFVGTVVIYRWLRKEIRDEPLDPKTRPQVRKTQTAGRMGRG